MKYKNGTTLFCIKTFYMDRDSDDDPLEIAYKKDEKYKICSYDETDMEWDVPSELYTSHTLNRELLDEYFILEREKKFNRILK